MSCKHLSTKLVAERCFSAPVATGERENPAAHGNITDVYRCTQCGAWQLANINQKHVELSEWAGPTFAEEREKREAEQRNAERAEAERVAIESAVENIRRRHRDCVGRICTATTDDCASELADERRWAGWRKGQFASFIEFANGTIRVLGIGATRLAALQAAV